jgi:hypothetical protein
LTQAKTKLKQASSWKRIVGEIAAAAWPYLSLSLSRQVRIFFWLGFL